MNAAHTVAVSNNDSCLAFSLQYFEHGAVWMLKGLVWLLCIRGEQRETPTPRQRDRQQLRDRDDLRLVLILKDVLRMQCNSITALTTGSLNRKNSSLLRSAPPYKLRAVELNGDQSRPARPGPCWDC